MAEGTTSDVPIRGEKTNVLFHPTPAISFKPMFETLERRAIGLCVGFTLGILFVGRMFGGSLWGLIPLAACIVSGVWLWMQEVIRSGRELEWSSEQLRGQTVRILFFVPRKFPWHYPTRQLTNDIGNGKSSTGICGMDEQLPGRLLGFTQP